MKIGFIGQGWIGKNYADTFEELYQNKHDIIRYALETPYYKNKDKIKTCDIVFIAVPTPTIKGKFDSSILKQVIQLVGEGKIAVIKSTTLPGTTLQLQWKNPSIYILHSPEFLREASAAEDSKFPQRNIIGLPVPNFFYKEKAEEVLNILPEANFNLVCSSYESELIKYAGNVWLYLKVVYVNMLFDLSNSLGADWDIVKQAIGADYRIGSSHLNPIHESGTSEEYSSRLKQKRGAGGNCFIKDYSAFVNMYKTNCPEDTIGLDMLKSIENKNIDLLKSSEKDIDILNTVY